MASYPPNFRDKYQIIAEMGKECGFPSNVDMPRPFTPRKTELPSKAEFRPIKSPNGLVYPRLEVEKQIHSLGTRLDLGKTFKMGHSKFECEGVVRGVPRNREGVSISDSTSIWNSKRSFDTV